MTHPTSCPIDPFDACLQAELRNAKPAHDELGGGHHTASIYEDAPLFLSQIDETYTNIQEEEVGLIPSRTEQLREKQDPWQQMASEVNPFADDFWTTAWYVTFCFCFLGGAFWQFSARVPISARAHVHTKSASHPHAYQRCGAGWLCAYQRAMWSWSIACLRSDILRFGFRLSPCRYWKIYAVIQAPVFVALVLTIPVVDFEEEGQRWCRPLNVMHLVTCPVFVCLGGGFGV